MFLWYEPWINAWGNNGQAGDLRCHHVHYDVIVMKFDGSFKVFLNVLMYFSSNTHRDPNSCSLSRVGPRHLHGYYMCWLHRHVLLCWAFSSRKHDVTGLMPQRSHIRYRAIPNRTREYALEYAHGKGGSRICLKSSPSLCLNVAGYSPGSELEFVDNSNVLYTYIYKGTPPRTFQKALSRLSIELTPATFISAPGPLHMDYPAKCWT